MRYIVAMCLIVVVGGCGASETDKARDVVQAFEDAVRERRPDDACSLMSVAGRRRMTDFVAHDREQNRGRQIETCQDAVAMLAGGERTVATDARLEGEDQATVAVEVPTSDDPDAGGSVTAVKEDGDWKVGTVF